MKDAGLRVRLPRPVKAPGRWFLVMTISPRSFLYAVRQGVEWVLHALAPNMNPALADPIEDPLLGLAPSILRPCSADRRRCSGGAHVQRRATCAKRTTAFSSNFLALSRCR